MAVKIKPKLDVYLRGDNNDGPIFFPWAAQDVDYSVKTWFLFCFSSDTKPKPPDSTDKGLNFKRYSVFYKPKTSRSRQGSDKT